MPLVNIAGNDFAIEVDGPAAAPVLLLSNSLSSDLSMWDEQMPSWSRHFRVVRYDARGHGRTPAPPGPYTIEQLGRDALGVLDHLGIARAHFCGLSMGGMVGMWLLTHAPERIGRAVLSNTSPHMGPVELWNGRIALAREGGMEATVEATVKRWFPASFHEQSPAAIDRMRAMIRRTSVAGYVGCCEAIRDMDQRESIRAIRNPVLVIIGAKDPATTPEAGRAIHAAIPGASVTVLDAAHISNVEQPAAYTRAVEEFLLAATPAGIQPPRFTQLALEQLDASQQSLGEQIMKVSSVGIGGPYNILLRSPVLGQRMFDLLHYLRWNTSLPLALNEFAILIVGRQWRSQVEWLAHGPIALKAGLPAHVVADLKANRRPAPMQPAEAAVYDFVTELIGERKVSDATFERARSLLGEQQVVDLTAVTGTYTTIAMLLEMAHQGVPPGREPPFGADQR